MTDPEPTPVDTARAKAEAVGELVAAIRSGDQERLTAARQALADLLAEGTDG